MPQPIRKPCKLIIAGLSQRPQHAEALGKLVSHSGHLESTLGWLMALLSRGSAQITVAMFHSVFSTEAQKSMLTAAAEATLTGPELDAYTDLMLDFTPRYRERNKLVHNLWGHSDEHPDKALWCKASDAASVFVSIANEPETIPPTSELSLKCMAYTVKDLNDVVERLENYRKQVFAFILQVLESHPKLVAASNAATNAPPIGGSPQLDLRQPGQTDPQSDPQEGE